MLRPPLDLRRRQRQEWWALALLLTGVAALVVWLRVDAYARLERSERERLERQSGAVQQVLAQQIQATYGAMLGVRDDLADWAPDGAPASGSRRLRALAAAVPAVSDIVVLDPLGRVRAASRPELVGSVPGMHPSPDDAGKLMVWAPVRDHGGRSVVVLVLPLAAPTAGGVVAALDVDYLRVVLRASLYGDDMRASVIHAGGMVALSEPPEAGAEASNVVRAGSTFQRHLRSGQASSLFDSDLVDTGESLLVSLHTIQPAGVPMDVPLVLTVSRDLDAVHGPWRQQTEVNVALYALLAAVAAGSLGLLQRRQRDAAMRERLEAERLGLALQGADLALWDVDVPNDLTTVNERWSTMLGWQPGEIGTDYATWLSLLHPEDRETVLRERAQHVHGSSERYEGVYRMHHRDGHWVWVLARGKVLSRTASGEPLRIVGTHMDISEQMEAMHAMRRSEESLAITLHSIGDAVIATDAQGLITRINATGARLTGWPEAEAVGRRLCEVFRIVDPRHGQPMPNPFDEVLAHGDVVGLANDTLLVARDGSSRQIADSAAPIRGADGVIAGVVLVFSDVSERYRAQQALRERERLLSAITDALPGPVSRCSREGRYLFANAAYGPWFGLLPEQVVGRTLVEVLGERRYAAIRPFVERALAGETVQYEQPMRTADGRRRHVLATLVPDREGDGEVVGIYTVVVDITDRKQAEDALRASEAKSRELLDHLLTGVVVHSPDGNVVEANPAACRILGLRLEQILGRAAPDPGWHFLEEDGARMSNSRLPVSQVMSSGQPVVDFVGGIQRPDRADPVWVLCNAFPLRRPDGALAQIVVTFLDITDRRRAEHERVVLERQLRESQKMESIGTLAGGIAHDFNNILAAILGNVAIAREELGAGHDAQAYLAQVQQAGLRARSLVQQILTFSRREPGALAVQPLQPIVQETLSLLRATLPAAVRVEALLPELPVPVRADATQLQQVLMNLATNAWHALPEADGRIEVGVERLGPEGMARLPEPAAADGAAHLWVRDNGCGIPPDMLERIFDPFFTTKPVGQGTGLGLSVVHGIVRAHAGAIEVESAPGRGCTFHLYLPSPELPAAPEADVADLPGSSHAPAGHVLLVDDDPVVLLMAERLLRRAGHRVSACDSAAEALTRLLSPGATFDVVVTDFNMPGASGLELAERVAALRPGLPVILSSGLLPENMREHAQRVGVRVLLRKENSFEELAPTVSRVLAEGAS